MPSADLVARRRLPCAPIEANPLAHPGQIVTHGDVRVTVLTDRLLRIEHAPGGTFEDRATLAVVDRRFPKTRFRTVIEGDSLTVDTGTVRLTCRDVTRPFTSRTLEARMGAGDTPVTWRYGKEAKGNLGGTVRTLDTWNGNRKPRAVGFDPETGVIEEWDEQALEPGLLSRDGWVVLDDTTTVAVEPPKARTGPGARPTPVPRPAGRRSDLYLFAHGDDHRAALADASRLLGPQPLPPRWAFGYWYSRYFPYTDRDLYDLAERFDAEGLPVDVLVIDMDWHRLGWTGYSWDRDLFPDPTAALERLRSHGLRIALNLHPADGVASHEDAFESMCEAVGLDPEATDRVPFDITDPVFVDAYFRHLHHPEEDRGVDLWWMDWQQGSDSALPGLDPLAWLNRLHWEDQARRRPTRRPMIFSRWGGIGAGRHPIGFSGDTHATWESLAFQPHFTATAANVLFGYWSHDIGGHFGAEPDPELYTRWIQFGAHSPILRTHGMLHPLLERRVWEYPNPYRTAMVDAIRRRYELVPYIYGEARRGTDTGLSLVRPMYHEHPSPPAAYEATDQYQLGESMIVAPVTRPVEDDSMAPSRVWLPDGRWYDVAHGRAVEVTEATGRWIERRYLLDEVPVHVRGGSIIPTQRDVARLGDPSYPNLVLTAHPGGDGRHDLYEDDGTTTGHELGRSVAIPLRHVERARRRTLAIEPAVGAYRGWLRRKPVEVRFLGEAPPRKVLVDDREIPWSPERRNGHWSYETARAAVVVSLRSVDLRVGARIVIERAGGRAGAEAAELLDGLPGLIARLSRIDAPTRALLGEDNRRIVGLVRTVERIDADPSILGPALRELRDGLGEVDAVLESAAARWRDLESLKPTDPPSSSRAVESARRLLASTLAELGG